ncbi:hypothetical protein ABIA39_002299 [Nocardia sp. GAS34]|uniref:hypothetical protein n=1 Tax=unclassified Nocardia TaxID=2637762 RepID=UPI003D19FC5E
MRSVTFGLGAAAAFATILVATPPFAAAAPQQLAPGVSCDGFTCRNDNDRDTYRVNAVVACSQGAMSVSGVAYVRPHTTATIGYHCPLVPGPLTQRAQPPITKPDGTVEFQPPLMVPGPSTPTMGIGIQYQGAQVDNTPPRPTGSSAG